MTRSRVASGLDEVSGPANPAGAPGPTRWPTIEGPSLRSGRSRPDAPPGEAGSGYAGLCQEIGAASPVLATGAGAAGPFAGSRGLPRLPSGAQTVRVPGGRCTASGQAAHRLVADLALAAGEVNAMTSEAGCCGQLCCPNCACITEPSPSAMLRPAHGACQGHRTVSARDISLAERPGGGARTRVLGVGGARCLAWSLG